MSSKPAEEAKWHLGEPEEAAGQEVGSVKEMQEVRISSRCMGTNGFP